jgi:hypothetical protein
LLLFLSIYYTRVILRRSVAAWDKINHRLQDLRITQI